LNFKSAEHYDQVFVFHKIEGRTFLLGRNGFYNKFTEELFHKCCGRMYFCLIFTCQNDEEKRQALDDLINKGDQNELLQFKNENKILFFNEETFEEDFLEHEVFKKRNLCFTYLKQPIQNDNEIVELNQNEKMFVESFIKKIDPVRFKCFIL
jgi:hypothetical protein